MTKTLSAFLLLISIFMNVRLFGNGNEGSNKILPANSDTALARDVVNETLRSWNAYKTYAWGHDALAPLSKSFSDWYSKPLYISPIDAYSTLVIMGLDDEAKEIENYVEDSLDFNINIDAKIFEVNIRILGGLLAMYEHSRNPAVLNKARDFADRMLPAFNTGTGIPKYWVNLSTGVARGDTVNVAEAATYTMEMGILSYYTNNPKYYQAGKKATLAIFSRRSELGLIGDVIDVETGKWVSTQSHICAGVDSYYEYLYKSYLLFGDEELGNIWKESMVGVHKYIAEIYDNKLWYGRVDMNSGKQTSTVITLYDAFFPAILAISGDINRAELLQKTWDWVWSQQGLEPTSYDYKKGTFNYPVYDLNPEIIESAYYLFHITGDSTYFEMNRKYWNNIKEFCRTDIAFTSVENVITKEKRDYMPTFFFAETLKYLYLTFSHGQIGFNFDDFVFNTEAHQFKRSNFDHDTARKRLNFK
ncbi:MAG: glycoside hydrolase family 47 protein [Lentimicrobium sp.]|jgi:mannosidase alpha-like ER degradation enhancer 1/mannosidase alpha-like ER degradation enhancer 2|nr:glycoside hydrolase family 47 protein [Lentimicrobium sp.]